MLASLELIEMTVKNLEIQISTGDILNFQWTGKNNHTVLTFLAKTSHYRLISINFKNAILI